MDTKKYESIFSFYSCPFVFIRGEFPACFAGKNI